VKIQLAALSTHVLHFISSVVTNRNMIGGLKVKPIH